MTKSIIPFGVQVAHSVPAAEDQLEKAVALLERIVLALTPSKEKFTNVYRNANITTVDSISREPRVLHGYYIYNTNAAVRTVRIYDKDNVPNLASDVPKLTIPVPSNGAVNLWMARGIQLLQGIAIGVSTGAGDYNATAPAAGDLIINVFYE